MSTSPSRRHRPSREFNDDTDAVVRAIEQAGGRIHRADLDHAAGLCPSAGADALGRLLEREAVAEADGWVALPLTAPQADELDADDSSDLQLITRVTITTSAGGGRVDFHADATPADIRDAASRARREIGVPKGLPAKTLERYRRLVEFSNKHGTGAAATTLWNRETGENKDRRNFRREARQARWALMSPQARFNERIREQHEKAETQGEVGAVLSVADLIRDSRSIKRPT